MVGDRHFITIALEEAEMGYERGEVPVGAVITLGGDILAKAHNSSILMQDPTAHAEIMAIRRAGSRVGNYRLLGTTLYVTIEPCIMCAGAIIQARISRVVFGAADPKNGAVTSLYNVFDDKRLNHSVEVTGGVLKKKCGEILSRFFQEKRVMSTS
jgi:tRNA(adenine34) deaminase